ncbi:MAG: uracil-DNA glycosylase [Candidatus Sumerlaeota bacterium]|nr:uracil-DNA glycosylase [Candidatus Sumerlaeota bacterium]
MPSSDIVFNQYRDFYAEVDVPNAASIRTANLRRYMASACEGASILVVGEAPGPWGCRFSGVPFIGERQLLDPSFPYRGERSSRIDPLRPTKIVPPFTSNSAEIFWEVMRPYHHRFVLWDAFPLHSHKPDDVLTVRNPTRKEVSQFGEALRLIKAYMEPTQVIAIGRKAFAELKMLGETPVYVRHPSRGGKAEFAAGMQRLFKNQE